MPAMATLGTNVSLGVRVNLGTSRARTFSFAMWKNAAGATAGSRWDIVNIRRSSPWRANTQG